MLALRASRPSFDSLVVVRAAALSTPPPLAPLAAWSAFFELLLGRLLPRLPLEPLGRSHRLAFEHAADLLRNLSTLAALLALAWGVRGLLALPALSIRRRFLLAGFAGTLGGTVALALLLPRPATQLALVALAVASGHVLAILATASAAAWNAPTGARIAMGAWTATLLFGLLNLVLLLLAPKLPWHTLWQPMRQAAHALAFAARHTSEVGFLLAPPALGLALLGNEVRLRRWTAAATLLAMLLGGAIAHVAVRLHEDFTVLLYGASRLSLFAETAPVLYGPLLGLAIAVAFRALLDPRRHVRQAGLGLLLLYAAGHLPRTASAGLWTGLGALLLARSVVAWAAAGALAPDQRSEASAEPSRSSPSSMDSSDAA